MSEHIFKLPDLGEGMVESEIGEWFIKVGDKVAEEDVIGSMMTDKAAVELSSPVSGVVKRLAGEPGDMVAVGAALVVFETEGDAPATDEPAAPTVAEVVEAAPAAAVEAVAEQPVKRSRVMTSPAVRRRAKEAGIDLTQVAGTGPGGRVTRADFDAYVNDGGATPAAAPAPAA